MYKRQPTTEKIVITSLTVALHNLQELDDNLGARPDEDLALPGLLGVVDALQGVVENGGADHFGGW